MNRIKDYSAFVGWFAGLGYIVIWPLTMDNLSGRPFGASIFCRDGPISVPDVLCNSPHPLSMPLGLHVIGFASAMFVTFRLLAYALRRSRRSVSAAAGQISPPLQRISAVLPKPPRNIPRPWPQVKPRSHFGLRQPPERAPVLQNEQVEA